MSLAHQIKPNGIAAKAMAALGAVPVDLIRVDGGTQSRAMLQNVVIEEYAAAIREGAEFPPVVVFYDGKDHWLADGFHRVGAFISAGIEMIPADVRQGTRRDAILYSVGANEQHGLRRTNEDKRRAVMVLLNDAEWAKWSNREIARQCNVSDHTVASLRPVTAQTRSEVTYTTKHGTTATMNTSAIGKTEPKEQEMYVEEVSEADLRRGQKIALPDDMTVEEVARRGMEREAKGEDPVVIAKSLQISAMNYRAACDVVYLHDRGGYSAKDSAIVDSAFHMMLDQKIQEAREHIEPVAAKVWGPARGHGRARADREPARVDQFDHAFGVIMHTCVTAAELDLPYLSLDDAKSAVREIKAARKHLQTLINRIEEVHNV